LRQISDDDLLHKLVSTDKEGEMHMKSREEIQASLEAGLAASGKRIEEFKAKLAEGGAEVSRDAAEDLAEMERAWEAGKNKLSELTAASDEKFDELWADTKGNWDSISSSMEQGWASVTSKFKNLF
jgi:hypothetical protein